MNYLLYLCCFYFINISLISSKKEKKHKYAKHSDDYMTRFLHKKDWYDDVYQMKHSNVLKKKFLTEIWEVTAVQDTKQELSVENRFNQLKKENELLKGNFIQKVKDNMSKSVAIFAACLKVFYGDDDNNTFDIKNILNEYKYTYPDFELYFPNVQSNKHMAFYMANLLVDCFNKLFLNYYHIEDFYVQEITTNYMSLMSCPTKYKTLEQKQIVYNDSYTNIVKYFNKVSELIDENEKTIKFTFTGVKLAIDVIHSVVESLGKQTDDILQDLIDKKNVLNARLAETERAQKTADEEKEVYQMARKNYSQALSKVPSSYDKHKKAMERVNKNIEYQNLQAERYLKIKRAEFNCQMEYIMTQNEAEIRKIREDGIRKVNLMIAEGEAKAKIEEAKRASQLAIIEAQAAADARVAEAKKEHYTEVCFFVCWKQKNLRIKRTIDKAKAKRNPYFKQLLQSFSYPISKKTIPKRNLKIGQNYNDDIVLQHANLLLRGPALVIAKFVQFRIDDHPYCGKRKFLTDTIVVLQIVLDAIRPFQDTKIKIKAQKAIEKAIKTSDKLIKHCASSVSRHKRQIDANLVEDSKSVASDLRVLNGVSTLTGIETQQNSKLDVVQNVDFGKNEWLMVKIHQKDLEKREKSYKKRQKELNTALRIQNEASSSVAKLKIAFDLNKDYRTFVSKISHPTSLVFDLLKSMTVNLQSALNSSNIELNVFKDSFQQIMDADIKLTLGKVYDNMTQDLQDDKKTFIKDIQNKKIGRHFSILLIHLQNSSLQFAKAIKTLLLDKSETVYSALGGKMKKTDDNSYTVQENEPNQDQINEIARQNIAISSETYTEESDRLNKSVNINDTIASQNTFNTADNFYHNTSKPHVIEQITKEAEEVNELTSEHADQDVDAFLLENNAGLEPKFEL